MTAVMERETVAEQRTIECFAGNTIEIPADLRTMTPKEEAQGYEAMTKWMQAGDRGCFRIMSPKDGDKRVVWCRRVIAEIKAAKKMFLDLISKGMIPYKVGVDGAATSQEMKEFDPTAEEVIFIPVRAIVGG